MPATLDQRIESYRDYVARRYVEADKLLKDAQGTEAVLLALVLLSSAEHAEGPIVLFRVGESWEYDDEGGYFHTADVYWEDEQGDGDIVDEANSFSVEGVLLLFGQDGDSKTLDDLRAFDEEHKRGESDR